MSIGRMIELSPFSLRLDRWKIQGSRAKKRRPVFYLSIGTGRRLRTRLLARLCSESGEDWEYRSPNRVDQTFTGIGVRHNQSREPLIRIVEDVHQALNLPEDVLRLDLDVDSLSWLDRSLIVH